MTERTAEESDQVLVLVTIWNGKPLKVYMSRSAIAVEPNARAMYVQHVRRAIELERQHRAKQEPQP